MQTSRTSSRRGVEVGAAPGPRHHFGDLHELLVDPAVEDGAVQLLDGVELHAHARADAKGREVEHHCEREKELVIGRVMTDQVYDYALWLCNTFVSEKTGWLIRYE